MSDDRLVKYVMSDQGSHTLCINRSAIEDEDYKKHLIGDPERPLYMIAVWCGIDEDIDLFYVAAELTRIADERLELKEEVKNLRAELKRVKMVLECNQATMSDVF